MPGPASSVTPSPAAALRRSCGRPAGSAGFRGGAACRTADTRPRPARRGIRPVPHRGSSRFDQNFHRGQFPRLVEAPRQSGPGGGSADGRARRGHGHGNFVGRVAQTLSGNIPRSDHSAPGGGPARARHLPTPIPRPMWPPLSTFWPATRRTRAMPKAWCSRATISGDFPFRACSSRICSPDRGAGGRREGISAIPSWHWKM